MGGKKRQETESSSSLRSLSGRRDSTSSAPAAGNQTRHHAKAVNVGCMSGIFRLVSKYHTRRKFLTFGKKEEVKASSPAKPKTTTITTSTITSPPQNDKDSSETTGRSSLETPRSPAISAEIRSSGSANSPRVVARLMGIADIPAYPPESVVVADSAVEKRRKLLGALEKCDEDLKALKRIIDAVRASQTPPREEEKVAGGGCGKREKGVEEEEDGEEVREDEPSPVSVLDFHQRSPPLTAHSKRTRHGQVLQQHHIQKQQKQKPIRKMKPGDDQCNSVFYFLNRSTSPSSVINITTSTSVFHPTKARSPMIDTARRLTTTTTLPWSKAMVESVEEVCWDVEWGQTREVGVIGLLIQDFIFKDLVEEITKEMMLMMKNKRGSCSDYAFGSSRIVSLPHEACKRKLCF